MPRAAGRAAPSGSERLTSQGAEPGARRGIITALAGSPFVLWAAFVLVHFWLGFLNLFAPGLPLGDVTFVYKTWAEQASYSHYYVGIDGVWVYPILALLPIVAAGTFGFANYAASWLSLIFVLDAIAFVALVGWRRPLRFAKIGWWWIAFFLVLGPIAMGRIDSITIPIAIVAVLYLTRRPRVAAVLLSVAMWIKVWPAAMLAAMIIAGRNRRRVLVSAVATSLFIIVVALLLGAGRNVFSFISQQTGRGLQVEAPVSTIWMWLSFGRVRGALVYYDQGILTYQVGGPGASVAAAIMTPILGLAVVAIVALGALAAHRRALVTDVLPPLALALISAFIAFNKVGSPQYMTWLAVPIILGLVTNATGYGRSFRLPAVLVLVIAALTQLFYPYLYLNLLELDPALLAVLTVRNILVFVLLGWAITVLWEASRRAAQDHFVTGETSLRSIWPFGESAPESAANPEPGLRNESSDRGMLDERFSEGE
jgi:hypothetical protein